MKLNPSFEGSFYPRYVVVPCENSGDIACVGFVCEALRNGFAPKMWDAITVISVTLIIFHMLIVCDM